ncbi:hypothetical protein RIF29_21293 [Crotalaria pallida]|uniref:Uncharacterized protein n=1 Tax=Crotalaria pallida TaxID=3830 RepID=A0AAN9F2I1_CROPI
MVVPWWLGADFRCNKVLVRAQALIIFIVIQGNNKNIQDPKKQPIKRTTAQDDDIRARQQTMQNAVAQDDMVARIEQHTMKRAAAGNDSSMAKKQPIIKGTTAGSDNSRTNQQPVKRKAMEDNIS